MKRLRLIRVRSFFVFGLITGLLIASSFSIAAARRSAEPSVTLLGSGNGLSALLTGATGRVLIVNGNDFSALANAFSQAMPDPLRRIDLVILMPGATERMAERAVRLASPARVFALPNQRHHPGNQIANRRIRAIDGTSEFNISAGLTVAIDPGGDDGWSMNITIGEAVIAFTQKTPLRVSHDVDLLVVGGPDAAKALGAFPVPVIARKQAVPGGSLAGHDHIVALVGDADVVAIRFRNGALTIDS